MPIQKTLAQLQQESATTQEALKTYLEVSKQTSESTHQLLEREFPELLQLRACLLEWEIEKEFSTRQARFYEFINLLKQVKPEVQHIYFEILFMKRLPSAKAYPYEKDTLATRIVEVYSQPKTGE